MINIFFSFMGRTGTRRPTYIIRGAKPQGSRLFAGSTANTSYRRDPIGWKIKGEMTFAA